MSVRSLWITSSCLLLAAAWMAQADQMSFSSSDGDAPHTPLPRSNFFALETMNLFGEEQPSDEEEPQRSIGLAPIWMGQYSTSKLRDMAMEHARLAEEALLAGDNEEAVAQIDQALARDPENVVLMGKAALIYASTHQYALASPLFRIYLQHYPDQIKYIAAWGGVLVRLRDDTLADEMLRRAIALDPADPLTRYHADILAIVQGKPQNCWNRWPQVELQQAMTVISSMINEMEPLLDLLGEEKFQALCDTIVGPGTRPHLKELVEVLQKYQKALIADDMPLQVDLGMQAKALGLQNQWIVLNLARVYYETDRIDDAWGLLLQMQRDYPSFAPVWFNGALIALNLERYEAAEYMYKRALQFGPKGEIFFGLACAYAGQNRIDEAWQIIKELKETQPDKLMSWLAGDEPYVRVIKGNIRYGELGLR